MANNSAHIKPILQLAKSARVHIHNGDLISLFPGELVGDVGTYLSGSKDKNIHERLSKTSAKHQALVSLH